MTADATSTPSGSGRPLTDTPDELLHHVAVLCRAANHLRRHLEHTVLRDARLTWASYDVLQLATGRRPVDARTITEVTGLAKATVTLAVKDLIARQLIRRLPRAGDHRYWLLQPTAAGLQFHRDLRTRLTAALSELLDHATDAAQHDAGIALHRISKP
ncbi:MarR family winged helix-turn-helix transcriptional regulator [Actinoplanes sp. NPDC026619]|uniref:MarR family winged helix-turn-helix transcriptional regulator n=1 Tax=Actinoplanes sp. NPDC026619 TaxID=3155798 RepID=UPI0033F3C396